MSQSPSSPSQDKQKTKSRLWQRNPIVFRLGWVSFFADISSEMLYPITPIFLTTILGASMASVGGIEGCAEATASLIKLFSGRFSDKISRRKPFVIFGYLLAALAKPLVGSSATWPQVLGARMLDRFGKGIRSAPRDALIAESVEPSEMGEAFGWHRGMDTLGAAIGPLLAIWYLNSGRDLRSIYYWAVVPGIVSVLFLMTLKEAKSKPGNIKKNNANAASPKSSFWKDSSSSLKIYLSALTIFALTNSSDVFLLLKLKAAGESTTLVILLYAGYNLIYALSSPWLGKLSDFWPKINIFGLGLFVFAGVYAGFAVSTELWQFVLLFACYGLYMGATDGVGKVLCLELGKNLPKATLLGWQGTLTGIATVVASITAGWLWDSRGPATAFYFGSAGALLAAALLFFLKFHKPANPT
jgi:MFS family permease